MGKQMNNKSVDILKRLKECTERGNLIAEKFPVEDVSELIYAEHKAWIEELVQNLSKYEAVYSKGIRTASYERDTKWLTRLMQELIEDLSAIPAPEVFVKEEQLKRVREEINQSMVRRFQAYAKKSYHKFSFYQQPLKLAFHGKGVIYTVITGGYDVLSRPEYIDGEFDYICFTDDPNLKSDIWNIRYMENSEGLDKAQLFLEKHPEN